MCLQRVLEDGYDSDEDGGNPFSSNGQTTSFKLALLTLIKNEIILEYDEE